MCEYIVTPNQYIFIYIYMDTYTHKNMTQCEAIIYTSQKKNLQVKRHITSYIFDFLW